MDSSKSTAEQNSQTGETSKKRIGDKTVLPEATKKPKRAETPLFQLPTTWAKDPKPVNGEQTSLNGEQRPQTDSSLSEPSSSNGPSAKAPQAQPRKGVFGFRPRDPNSPKPTPKVYKQRAAPSESVPVAVSSPPSILAKPTVEQTLPARYVAEGMSVDHAVEKVVSSTVLPTSSSVVIVIDTANVSHEHGEGAFSTKGLPLVVEHYKSLGFKTIVAFLPEHYLTQHYPDPLQDWTQLEALVAEKVLIPTPGADYDDLYLVGFAKKNNGVIVTNDKYRDVPLAFTDPKERQSISHWIKTHRIPFKFTKDVFSERISPARHPLKDLLPSLRS